MSAQEIRSDIDAIQAKAGLREEENFAGRFEAMDFLEFNVIERIEGLLQRPDPPADLLRLQRDAERIKHGLEAIDEALFRRLRNDIRMAGGAGKPLQALIAACIGPETPGRLRNEPIGYDCLDAFINGLLHLGPFPSETQTREPGMVFFQKTPARIILEMAEKARLTEEDVFYDLGSGLGQVSILVNLLSGAPAKGIEFEPAYCGYARACAADLNLPRVEFLLGDARDADYSAGSVFFLYSSFEGEMLEAVLEKLRRDARKGIRLFTYGPCTPQVSRRSWLKRIDGNEDSAHKLGEFAGN